MENQNPYQPTPGTPAPGQLQPPQPITGIPRPGQLQQPVSGVPVPGIPTPGQLQQPVTEAPVPGQPNTGVPGQGLPYQPVIHPPKPKPPFHAEANDALFALAFFFLGYAFIRWELFFARGAAQTIFTFLYTAVVLSYALVKKRTITKQHIFWLVILLLCSFSSLLWLHNGFFDVVLLFLMGIAVYWTVCLCGCNLSAKNGDYIPMDMINGFFITPFRNFSCSFRALGQGAKKLKQGRALLSVLLGLFLCIPVMGIVLPLLISADNTFAQLIENFADRLYENFASELFALLLGVPVACYLYGLTAGSLHRRNANTITAQGMDSACSVVRIMPTISVYTVLSIICATYLLFICLQAGYLFSAFQGVCPAGYESYSAYARQGFFELCKAAGFNAFLLFLGNTFCKKSRKECALRFFNTVLSILTLLLIVTSFSKMALYVSAFGLSHKRLLTCWFMVFLAGVFLLILFWQKRTFSVVRAVCVLGAVMFTILCCVNVDGIIANSNLNRYRSGDLPGLSMEFLYDCGYAGVAPATKLYYETEDAGLREELKRYFSKTLRKYGYTPTSEDWMDFTLDSIRARALLERLDLPNP